MANAFTSNQVNHIYVVSNDLISAESTINANSNKGSIQVKTDEDGIKYFKYRGGTADIQRSDLLTNIEYIRVTPAGKIARPLMRATITVNSSRYSNGNLRFASGTNDSNSYLGKGVKLDL